MLAFDFDASQLRAIAQEFDASPKQIQAAYSRALRRTASTMKTHARKEIRSRLDLRSAKELRKRLHGFKFKRGGGSAGDMGSVRMWFGLNDMKASAFKGRPRAKGTGSEKAGRFVDRGFVGKNRSGATTIMRRVGRSRYPIAEARFSVEDEMRVVVEDEVFDQIDEVFFRNFRAEIRSRTIYGVG